MSNNNNNTEQSSSSSVRSRSDDENVKLKLEILTLQKKVMAQSLEIDRLNKILKTFFTPGQIKQLKSEENDKDINGLINQLLSKSQNSSQEASVRLSTNIETSTGSNRNACGHREVKNKQNTNSREMQIHSEVIVDLNNSCSDAIVSTDNCDSDRINSNIETELDVDNIETLKVDKSEFFVNLDNLRYVEEIDVKNEPDLDFNMTRVKLELPEFDGGRTCKKCGKNKPSAPSVATKDGKNESESCQCMIPLQPVKHMKEHAVKRFRCPLCPFTTSFAPNLKRHVLIHGDKPYKCSVCDFASTRKADFSFHMNIHTGVKPYKCTECDYAVSHPNNLKLHIRRKHTGDRPYKCSMCDYSAANSSDLKKHMPKHTGDKPYKCTLCDYSAVNKSDIKIHMPKHSGEKPFQCTVCQFSTANCVSLKNHSMLKHPETLEGNININLENLGFDEDDVKNGLDVDFCDNPVLKHSGFYDGTTCNKCNKVRPTTTSQNSTETQNIPKQHLEICHCPSNTNKTPYICPICSYTTTRNYDLQRHMNKHGVKRFKCTLCPFATSFSPYLKRHVIRHVDKQRYLCSACGRGYKNRWSLSQHMLTHSEQNHPKPKSHKCNFCDYAATGTTSLKRHMRIHTKEKPFLCSICGHAYRQAKDLVVHMRTHSGEKPYKCDFCDYASTTKSVVLRHNRIKHLQLKPHKCSVCDYASSTSDNLKRHMRQHTGEKPYKCDLCGYASTQLTDYKDHVRRHTGERPYKCNVCEYAAPARKSLSKHMKTHLRVMSQ